MKIQMIHPHVTAPLWHFTAAIKSRDSFRERQRQSLVNHNMPRNPLPGLRHRKVKYFARRRAEFSVDQQWIALKEIHLQEFRQARQRPQCVPLRVMAGRELPRSGNGINATAQLVDNTSLDRTKLAFDQSAEAWVGRRASCMRSPEIR